MEQLHSSKAMKNVLTQILPILTFVIGLACCPTLLAETDNFNDGDDAGWTRYTPVTAVSTPTFSFPQGSTYRLQATGARVQDLGPARVGSYLPNATNADFYVSLDLVDWDNSLDQIFGLLARMSTPGLGTLNGYALTYATRTGRAATGQLEILRVTNERGTRLAGAFADISLDPAKDYRFVFVGAGINFTGMVYLLPDTVTPVATIAGVDGTYTQGLAGFFTYDNGSPADNPVDVTFDNFVLFDRQPPALRVFLDDTLFINVSWETSYQGWALQMTSDPLSGEWTDIQSEVLESSGRYTFSADGTVGNKFFRLVHP